MRNAPDIASAGALESAAAAVPYQQMVAPLRRLFSAAVVAIIAAAAIYSMLAWNEAKRDQYSELRHLSEIIARSSGQVFDSYMLSLRWFAPQISQPLREGRIEEVMRLLRRYQQSDATLTGITVLGPDGKLLATTLPWRTDEKSYNVKSTVGAGDGFEEISEGGGPRVTRTILTSRSRDWSIPVRYPVRDDAGNVQFVISVLLSAERLGKIWQSLSAPPGTVYLLLRPDGYRQLRVPAPANPDAFYSKSAVNVVTDALLAYPERRSDEYEITRTSDSQPVVGAYTRLSNYALAAAVSVPQRQLWDAWVGRVAIPLLVLLALLLGLIAAHANARALQRRINRDAQAAVIRMRETEDRLTLALNGAGLALWDWDETSGMVYLSERWNVMLGGEMQATYSTVSSLLDRVHPEDRDAVKAGLFATLKDDSVIYHTEHRVRRHNGDWIWVESQGRVFERNSEGRATRMAGTNADITERKGTETTIRETQALLHSIFENIPDMVFVKDAQHLRFAHLNRAGEALLGCDRSELIGKSDFDLFPEAQANAFVAKDREVLSGHAMVEISEESVTTRNKGVRYLNTKKISIFDEWGNPAYLLGISSDVTARKEAALALHESEERFSAAFDQASVGMGLRAVDPLNSRWLRVNQKLCDLLNYSQAELLQLTSLDITPLEDRETTVRGQEQLASGARDYVEREKWLQGKNGRCVWVNLSTAVVRGADGCPAYCLSIFQDISDRKRLEEQRLERDREQRRVFVREIHHRIKNHIQGVAGLLSGHARREPALAPKIHAAVKQLQVVAVVHGLQGTNEERPALEQVLPAICTSVQDYVGGGVAIDYRTNSQNVHGIHTDEAVPMALIINELITNAVKHSPVTGAAGGVVVQLDEFSDGVCVNISNSGQLHEGLFEERRHQQGEGLRIVRSLLPAVGAEFKIINRGERVCATLTLQAPVITSGQPLEASALGLIQPMPERLNYF